MDFFSIAPIWYGVQCGVGVDLLCIAVHQFLTRASAGPVHGMGDGGGCCMEF